MQKTAKNGTITQYKRDLMGRVEKEKVYGDETKKTQYIYNALHLIKEIDPEGNVTQYEYDFAGRVKEIVKNEGRTEYFYDSLGRLSEMREYYGKGTDEYRVTTKKYDALDRITEECLQSADGTTLHVSRYDYDIRGNLTLIQTGDSQTQTEYNSWNQPLKIIDSLGHETHITYNTGFINKHDQKVLQKKTTDPLGYQTVDTYDTADRLVESTRLNIIGEKIARQHFFYDLVGNLIAREEKVIEQGQVVRTITTLFSYDSLNQLTKTVEAAGTPEQKTSSILYNSHGQQEALVKSDGKSIHYTYDAFGRLKTCTSSDNTIDYIYTYNLLDQVTSVLDRTTGKATTREYFQGDLKKETLSNGLSIEYTYDRIGRVRTLTLPDRTGIEYVYNAVDLKEIHRIVDGGRTYSHRELEHSLSGQITQASPPGNNGSIDYRFDPLDRCIAIESKGYRQHIPEDGFDPAGNLLKCNIQNIPYTFAYDDHYNLTKETGHSAHTYTFDSVANRTTKDNELHRYNALNQLTQKGEQLLVYDSNGNLEKNDPQEYAYDALNRLTKVSCKGAVTTYAYDAFNRRVAKNMNGDEEPFLYQGMDEIGRWINGVCQEFRLLGNNPSSRTVAIEIQEKRYIPLHDIRGSITTLIDFQGNIVEQYRYSAFGEREFFSPSGERQQKSAAGNPWQYSGKRFDEESGLLAFGMRYYDPSLGRWTTPDPADFIDGTNLYAYVHNNPLLYVDQYGLFGESIFESLPDFEWGRRMDDLSLSYQSAKTAVVDTWNSPHFLQGSMQAVGGLAEATSGAGMILFSEGLALPIGCAVMAHGVDNFRTGMKTAFSGSYGETATSQLLQMGGVSPQYTNIIDTGLSIAGPSIGISLAMGGAKLAKTAYSTCSQILKSTRHLASQEVKYMTKGGLKNIVGCAESPIGHQGWEIKNIFCQPVRNQASIINGRLYSGHALDQMQNRGLMPSIIENTIKNGRMKVGKRAGTIAHYDSINNVNVITNSQSRKVITAGYGQIRQ